MTHLIQLRSLGDNTNTLHSNLSAGIHVSAPETSGSSTEGDSEDTPNKD